MSLEFPPPSSEKPEYSREYHAYQIQALPKYVFQDSEGNWTTWEAELGKYDPLNPKEMYEAVNEDAIVPLDLTLEDICLFYAIVNLEFLKSFSDTFYLREELALDDETEQILFNILEKLKQPALQKQIYKRIETAKNQFQKTFVQKYSTKIQATKKDKAIETAQDVLFTPFVVESVYKTYKIHESIVGSIYTLFNNIQLSEEFPMASSFQFYKVLKGYQFSQDTPEETDVIYLFSIIQGKVEITKTETCFEISYNYTQSQDDQPFLEKICETIGISISDVELARKGFNGKSLFMRQQLDLVIWKDLIMNREEIYPKLVINENPQTPRKTERKIDRKIFQMFFMEDTIKKNILFILPQEDGVSVRVQRAETLEEADRILKFMSSVFGVYNALGNQIAKDYNRILKNNLVEYTAPTEKVLNLNRPLKEIAPDMFLPKYTRTCMHLPSIVSPEQAEELELKEGYQVMQFPKESDDYTPYYFSCHKHKKYVYPGLRKNILGNKAEFPLLPCCYIENQQRRSIYQNYFNTSRKLSDFKFTKETQTVEQIQQRFLISDKFVGVKQTGKCSDEINQLFMLYSKYRPARKGVHRTKLSALECILTGLNVDGFQKENSEDKLAILTRELERIKKVNIDLCAQECWNLEHPETLLDEETYLEPRYFIRLLEYAYRCRLVFMNRTNFIHPNYIQGYFRWKHQEARPILFIYEHYGSEADQATYPQCELIELDSVVSEIPSAVAEAIYKIYLETLQTVTPVPSVLEESFIEYFESEGFVITEQHIDYYGKTFALNVQMPNKTPLTLFLEHTRMAPLVVSRATEYYPHSGSLGRFVVSGNRARARIANLDFYVLIGEKPASLLESYERTQLQVSLMLENAKRIYIQRLEENIPESKVWDFIQIASGRVEEYSKFFFTDADTIYVPNRETRKRLQYALRLYTTRYPTEAKQYLNTDLVFPFKYKSVQDFDRQENCILAENNNLIHWYNDFYNLLPIDGTLYSFVFVCKIQEVIYKCTPIETIPENWKNYILLFPQVKKEFKVGKPTREHILLLIQNVKNEQQLYQCMILHR